MRHLARILAVLAVVFWSLFAWGAYALVGWVGDLVTTNADWFTGHADTVVWLSWATNLLTNIGLAGVVMVWLIGIALILAIPKALRLVGRRAQRPVKRGPGEISVSQTHTRGGPFRRPRMD
jgi:hypothetical protein